MKRALAIILALAALTSSTGFSPTRDPAALEAPGIRAEQSAPPLISDSQFVWGPENPRFDVHAYLSEQGSGLAPYAGDIELWASYTSVNPRVLMTLLEMRHGWVSSAEPAASSDEIRAVIEDTATRLAETFYNHLYTYGSRKDSGVEVAPLATQVTRKDGVAMSVDPETTSGSFALAVELATTARDPASASARSATAPASFDAQYAVLFPGSDPLDDSVSIDAAELPPVALLQFPFPVGATWVFSGPHSWSGGSTPPPFSSMDFFCRNNPACSPVGDDPSVSAAPGVAWHPYGYDCWIEIAHGDGWTTSYYHLRETIPDSTVDRNAYVGLVGVEVCAGGFATGPHVHFSLKYNGAHVSLEGVKLTGWTVHVGPDPYESGWIEREGIVLGPYSYVVNDYYGVFSDVPFTHWAHAWVETLFRNGLTAGCSTAPLLFCPEYYVKRGEMAVFLLRGIHGASYAPPAPDGSSPFTDIAGHWAESWIEDAYDQGLVSGFPDGTFRPGAFTTRGEMAVLLLRAKHGAGYTPPEPSGGAFTDIAGHWAEAFIEQLKLEGVTAGYADGTYRPESQVTRAEMAVFLVRTFDLH